MAAAADAACEGGGGRGCLCCESENQSSMRVLPPPFRRRLKPALELLAADVAPAPLPLVAPAVMLLTAPAALPPMLAAAGARVCARATVKPSPLLLGEVAAPVALRGLELALASPFAAPAALPLAPLAPVVVEG